MFGTFTCGLYHLVGVETDAPRVVFSTAFQAADCAVPVVVGRWWIQTVPALHALVALDVSDPSRLVRWLDGYTGLTVPHGSVFSRP